MKKRIGLIGLGNVGSKIGNNILMGGFYLYINDHYSLSLQQPLQPKSQKIHELQFPFPFLSLIFYPILLFLQLILIRPNGDEIFLIIPS